MRIQKAVIEDTISMKKAGLLLYSMQLALTNVGQTTFGQAKDEEMVRVTVDEDEAFSEKQNQQQRPLTAKDAEPPQQAKTGLAGDPGDAKENQGLLRMNTEGTDFGERGGEDGGGDVEFMPVPGGYGFERVRLRIDASGHRTIAPHSVSDRQSAISLKQELFTAKDAEVAKENQTHAVLG